MDALALSPSSHWGPIRRTLSFVLLASLVFGTVIVPEAWATDYYVDTGGLDTNTGLSGAPWKTLTHALDTAKSGVTSGDVIHVAAGTYDTPTNGETFPLALVDDVAIIGDTTTPSNCVISAPVATDVFYNDDTPLSATTRLAGVTLQHDADTDSPLMYFGVNSATMSPQIDHNVFAGCTDPRSVFCEAVTYDDEGSGDGVFTPVIDRNTFNSLYTGTWQYGLHGSTGNDFSPTITNNTFTGCDYPVNYTMSSSAEGTVGGLVQGNTFRTTIDVDVYIDFNPSGTGTDLIFNPTITGNDMGSGASTNVWAFFGPYSSSAASYSGYSGNLTFSPAITNNTMGTNELNVAMEGYYSFVDGNYTIAPTISGNTMTGAYGAASISMRAMSVSSSGEQINVSPTIANNTLTAREIGVVVDLAKPNNGVVVENATITGNTITSPGLAGIYIERDGYSGIAGMTADWTISNNTITSPEYYGMSFYQTSMSFSGTGTSNLTVEGNTVTDANQGGSGGLGIGLVPGAWGAANAVAQTVLIRGNTVTGGLWDADGMHVSFYGETGNTLDARITDNVLRNNALGGLAVISSGLGSNGILVACNTITGNGGNGVLEFSSGAGLDPPADYGGGNRSSPGNNVITGNGDGVTTFDFNNQRGNGSGLIEAKAQHNWWGAASGPAAGQTSGPVDTSNFLTAAPTVTLAPELTAAVVNDVAPPGPSIGDTIEYTATITPAASSCGDTGLGFSVPIPANATLVPNSVTTSQGTVTGTSPITVTLGSVSSGETITITWQVIPTSGTELSSQGAVTATSSGTTPTDDPGTPAPNDPTVTPFTVPQPGTVQFAVAAASVNEGAGTVTLDVTRTGGSAGAITVDYASANGTATAPADYGAVSGQLNWADGDATTKQIVISIVDDTQVEGNETFTVTLTDVPGSAFVGSPATATVTIQDNDQAPIPTLGGWGLLALGGLLLLGGVLLLRRRRYATAGLAIILALGAGWVGAAPMRHAMTRHDPPRASFTASTVQSVAVTGKTVTLTLADGTSLTVPRHALRVRDLRTRPERPDLSGMSKAERLAFTSQRRAERQAARAERQAQLAAMTPEQRAQMREQRRLKREQEKAAMAATRRDPSVLLTQGAPVVVRVERDRDGRIRDARVEVVASEARARTEVERIEARRAQHQTKRAVR
jgi:hypothetical protein